MTKLLSLSDAREVLLKGSVLAYPTEAVYGLGCDPFNETAVQRLLRIKRRSVAKGLIVLVHDWDQLFQLVSVVPDRCLDRVRATWPGPVTWLFPKARGVPVWLSGEHPTLAVRMTDHPVAQALCVDGPLVSTSANIMGHEPARTYHDVLAEFPEGLDGVVEGVIGMEATPSSIFDVISGAQLR